MRVASYSRFSTERQSESSIEDQQRVCREYAERKGWIIGQQFCDEGISGAATGNRPGVQAALAYLLAGDTLLIADTTRLARSQDLAPMIERLRFRGVRVIGVLDGFDSDSPQARMQAGLSGLMSDEMRANIRVRTHSALEMRARTGGKTGGKAYGYTSAGEVIEAEAVIVREIFARTASGESLRALAVDLNLRGVVAPGAGWKDRTDACWRVSAIHALLGNERYTGRVVWNRSRWWKDPDSGVRVRRERPAGEWVVAEGSRIVDQATWEAVRARLTERKRVYGTGRGASPRYLLSGLLVCEACGQRMVTTGKDGARYRCATHHHAGACRMTQSVRRLTAEAVILLPVRERMLSPEAVEHAAGLIRQWHRQDRAAGMQGQTPDVLAIDAELADLHRLIAERPARAALMADAIQALERRRTALLRAAWRQSDSPDAEAEYRRTVAEAGETLAQAGSAARELLRRILGEVPVHSAGNHLVATVNLRPLALLPGAGSWIGSGGVHWTGELILARAA